MKVVFISILFVILSMPVSNSQVFEMEDVVTELSQPNAFDFLPNGNIIITEKAGPVKVFSPSGSIIDTFWNFHDSSFYFGEMGTLGISVDPDYNSNHYIYVYYVSGNVSIFNFRIVRFTENNNRGTYPAIVFDFQNPIGSGNTHAAGNIHFRTDGTLFFGIGSIETACNAQVLTCPRGKILRIDKNGNSPLDNPFYDDGNPAIGNDDRIWALGLRNPYEFCISPLNDSIYSCDNGSGPDEINFIRKGKNYGYPFCQGICGHPVFIDPVLQLPVSTVPTGIIFYSGNAFPELQNKLLFASYSGKKIYVCNLANAPIYDTVTSYYEWINLGSSQPNIIKQGVDGNIYVSLLGTNKLVKIKPGVIGINIPYQTIGFSLSQNYPNPFNPATNIKFEVPKSGWVTMRIFNSLGIEVSTLLNETRQQGIHEVFWDASNFPSGVYFYELRAGEYSERKKMVLIK